MSEYEKKEIEPVLTDYAFNVYNLRIDIVQKYLWISGHFVIVNHIWRLDIVFLSDFENI